MSSRDGDNEVPTEPQFSNARASSIDVGLKMGRYTIGEPLGSGGMGAVYAAHDPQLDREVAVKVLRDSWASEEARQRLIFEAQMMARMSHPNVVTVYEVGASDGEFFIAMECVRGTNLEGWVQEQHREWQEIVDKYRQAGMGIAAAHEAGMIHRDFKPANVLLGDDGRIRVTDFGLAKTSKFPADAGDDQPADATPILPESDHLSSEDIAVVSGISMEPKTESGVFHGTAPYVAPEVFQGREPTELSDQYSFCVSLWQSLFGSLPYHAQSLARLQMRVVHGELPKFPAEPALPKRLQRVLVRGLAKNPNHRFPSMNALISELERVLNPRRGLILAALATAVLGAGAATAWFMLKDPRAPAVTCDGGSDRMAEIWSADKAEEIRLSLAKGDQGGAEDMFAVIKRELDTYSQKWGSLHDRACSESRIDKTHPEDLMVSRMHCLDRLYREYKSLVALLGGIDAEALPGFVAAAYELTPAESCMVPAVDDGEDPEELREEIGLVRQQLADAISHERAGMYKRGAEIAQDALTSAEALDHPATTARVLLQLGRLQWRAGTPKKARETLMHASELAEKSSLAEIRLRSLIELIWVSGHELADAKESEIWARLADSALNTLESPPPELKALLVEQQAIAFGSKGNWKSAASTVEQALRMREKQFGPKHPLVAALHNKLSAILLEAGEVSDSYEHINKAIKIYEETTTKHHPGLAFAHNNLGSILAAEEKFSKAEEQFKLALKYGIRTLGPTHAEVALIHANLGAMAAQRQDYRTAIRRLTRAVEIERTLLGENHLSVADSETNLATVYDLDGDAESAHAHCLRALAIRKEILGREDAAVIETAAACEQLSGQ